MRVEPPQAAHKTRPKTLFLWATLGQLIIVIVALPIAYVLAGSIATLSLFCGAMCAVVPQGYFAYRMTKASRESAPRAAKQGLAAEGGKFLLSAAGFAVVFAVIQPGQPGLVFVGFVVVWLVQLAATVYLLNR